ncbi:hypothetical protein FA13DRAFT_555772 [Coprinellus micaceus]|uniref:Uncharacterized protein n=1 Tax=Coprinellus micaceus TaxID=71717 RepID=A0A4Y7T8J6_COPMI|nr:hypothetical protein FA13DRAFT_555772 [Coprinellus micaceus]
MTSTTTSVPSARPAATCSPGVLDWSFNSRRQDPCFVGATIAGGCFPLGYSLAPLPPDGGYQYRYITPEEDTLCTCNTVYYSLESACAACQHERNTWDRWMHWSANCTRTYTTYPRNIPASVTIPAWAYLDVIAGNTFNITLAQSHRDFNLFDSCKPCSHQPCLGLPYKAK